MTTPFATPRGERSQPAWRVRSSLMILAVACIALLARSGTAFAAQTTPPPYAHAWYISNPDPNYGGAMYTLGYNDGARDGANCTNALVVLDYGQPTNEGGPGYNGYGTYDYAPGFPFVADSTIEQATDMYAWGWYNASANCARLRLAIGDNNYNQCPYGGACTPTGAGQQWGSLANNVENWVKSKGFSWQILVGAGDDMEQPGGGQAWDCATKTRAFVDGFHSNNPSGARLVDYGTAWVPVQNCWSAADVAYVAYQATPDYPLPEIYTGPSTDSWVTVRKSYFMYFAGVFAECQQPDPIPGSYCTNPSGQFSPTGAWYDLWNKLNSNNVGQKSLNYATNIKWQ